jgi:hypothetical protein
MIIKHIDNIISNKQFDIDLDGDVSAYLVEITGFTEDKGLVEWAIVGETNISRKQLHYDDTADGSTHLTGSWRNFYVAKSKFGELTIFKGSSFLYKDGAPNFGGIAKAASYLRYSEGFYDWLNIFDSVAGSKIREELPLFDDRKRFQKGKYDNRTFEQVWQKFKAPKGRWCLPVLCNLTNGKKIVLGLQNADDADWDDLEDLDVDIDKSLEIMNFLESPEKKGQEIISDLFQMANGLGRNPFGKKINLDTVSDAEYTRLMGVIPVSERTGILDAWSNKCSYQIKVAPNPEKSELIYLPEGDVKFSSLVNFSNEIIQRRTNYFEQLKRRKNKSEDTENLIKEKLSVVPIPNASVVTMYLINKEGSQKEKIIIQNVFPSVSLDYFASIDAELLGNNTENIIVGYMKKALTAQDKGTPSTYIFWTKTFTSVLQKNYISAYEVFNNLQRFTKAFSGDELINKGKARDYFYVIGKLKRLQHIVDLVHQGKSIDNIEVELVNIEKNIINSKGVFGMNKKEMPDVKDIIGEVYDDLRDYEQEKINAFMRKSWTGVPNEDFKLFVRGGLVGILLNELTWLVTKEGRSFSVTQGRHPSTLRGKDIQKVCEKGIGLLIGVDKAHCFNGKAALFIQSCIEESRKDSFNSGLIMGLVFNYKTKQEEKTQND